MKQKIIIGIVVLAAVALVSGSGLLAFASPGTQNDPFITLSYLSEIFKPQIMAEVDKIEKELTANFNEQIAELEAKLQSSQRNPPVAPGSADTFSVITLGKGKTLTCSVGTEIMLRIGTATGFGSAPALVDSTNGETLSSGSALVTNHMYIVTIEGNGVKSTADTVKVLVRGNYKIT